MSERVCGDHELLQRLAEGTLTGAELEAVRAHVSACRACRLAVSEYKQVMWDLAHPPEVPLPVELDRMHDALMQAWRKAARERTGTRPARSFVPAWAGYTVSWTRNLPAAGKLGALLRRTGRSVVRRSLPGWLRRMGSGDD